MINKIIKMIVLCAVMVSFSAQAMKRELKPLSLIEEKENCITKTVKAAEASQNKIFSSNKIIFEKKMHKARRVLDSLIDGEMDMYAKHESLEESVDSQSKHALYAQCIEISQKTHAWDQKFRDMWEERDQLEYDRKVLREFNGERQINKK